MHNKSHECAIVTIDSRELERGDRASCLHDQCASFSSRKAGRAMAAAVSLGDAVGWRWKKGRGELGRGLAGLACCWA